MVKKSARKARRCKIRNAAENEEVASRIYGELKKNIYIYKKKMKKVEDNWHLGLP